MEPVHASRTQEAGWAKSLNDARNGNPSALGRLLDQNRPALLAVTARLITPDLRAKADESDLVQEALLDGLMDFHTFLGERPEQLFLWLKRILEHKLSNLRRQYLEVRKRAARREVPLCSVWSHVSPADYMITTDPCPDEAAARQEELDQVSRAVDRLPALVQVVVVWRSREGLPFVEIGRRLGRTPAGARQIWWRAVAQLRIELVGRCSTDSSNPRGCSGSSCSASGPIHRVGTASLGSAPAARCRAGED